MSTFKTCCILTLLAAIFGRPALSTEATYQDIVVHMAKLSPMLGSWQGDISFYDRDGTITKEVAAYDVHVALDGTYLETEATIWRNGDRSKQHSFKVMTTYNPDTGKYDQTYFYSRWAMRVTEVGDFEDASKEFRTASFIPREDGKRDESVHTTTKFRSDGTIEHWHWSRYNDEKTELMNFHLKLTRSH